MAKTIIGIFQERNHVEMAIDELRGKGFEAKDISILMKDKGEAKEMGDDTGAKTMGGAATGAGTGAVLGGLAGLATSFVFPGLGAFFIGGPIASALGLTGAAAATASGAATGAVAGGLLGALTGLGLSDDEAEYYEGKVKEGAILLAVPALDDETRIVDTIFRDHEASDIRTISQREGVQNRTTSSRHADRAEQKTSHSERRSGQFASAGMKGGHTKTSSRSSGSKSSSGRGWHGDSEGHRAAARGEDVPGRGDE